MIVPSKEKFVSSRLTTMVLATGLGFCLLYFLQIAPTVIHLPGDQQGYEPVQPIRFSHRLHAGDLQIARLYCHFGAERSRNAGIPAANACMNCHKFVPAPFANIRAEAEAAQEEKREPRQIVLTGNSETIRRRGLCPESATGRPAPADTDRVEQGPPLLRRKL